MSRFVLSIDQSTSSSKVYLLDENGEIIREHAQEHHQFFPSSGYAEHDAAEIWENVCAGLKAVTEGIGARDLAAIGISNQRETTVFWDRETGSPLCHAIVWQDVRGQAFCDSIASCQDFVHQRTGLSLSPYYPAAKMAAALQEYPQLHEAARAGRLCAGTVDSYLVYRLTQGRVFRTDVSNAARTQLLSLDSLTWDKELCALFGVNPDWLPEVVPSDGEFGDAHGVPICGVMGDSHASLFGHGCVRMGKTKATYGTGSSVMMNVGEKPVHAAKTLNSCVAFGFGGKTYYALEGNVTCSGDTLCFLRDNLHMISSSAESESLARSVPDNGGVYLVPAFSGLGAPYFDTGARGIICGMNRATTAAHIVRAALESIAYQDMDIADEMQRVLSHSPDSPIKLTSLHADGGPTHNAFLMQLQADMMDCPVICARHSALSALGAGYMAGIRAGIYHSLDDIPARLNPGAQFTQTMPQQTRDALKKGWHDAVARCSNLK